MPETLTSAANPRLKLVRRLATRRGRQREGAFAVEGEDLLAAAVASGWTPRFVLADAEAAVAVDTAGAPQLLVPPKLLADVAELAHPPRVIAVFDLPRPGMEAGTLPAHGALVYLDGVRDPGNVGTVLRTADAFGIAGVALGAHTADPFSPKATRASMGAVFRVPAEHVPGPPPGRTVVALDAGADVPLHEAQLGEAPLLCIGAERDGVSAEVLEAADVVVAIPQRPGVDSLNAATAAAVVLYEWQRQRMEEGAPPWA